MGNTHHFLPLLTFNKKRKPPWGTYVEDVGIYGTPQKTYLTKK
jgi:hypothetical protein